MVQQQPQLLMASMTQVRGSKVQGPRPVQRIMGACLVHPRTLELLLKAVTGMKRQRESVSR